MKPITITEFKGMNNIKAKEGPPNQPRIILNADVTDGGRIVKRDGVTEFLALTNPHSLWSGTSCMLCMCGSKLYRIDDGTATEICSVTAPDSPASYIELDSKVYISNKYWNGVFNPADNTVSSWGQTVPNMPILTSNSNGVLPAAAYHVSVTSINSDGDLSGASNPNKIVLTTTGGITLTGRGVTDIVWCSDPNGTELYRVGTVDSIGGMPPTIEPCQTLFCYPPLKFENLVWSFGRMWGSRGDKVYYSEPFRNDLWKLHTSFFKFEDDIRMIAKSSTGLFIGTDNKTYFLGGKTPETMSQVLAGSGVIAGTLTYVNDLKELGDTISPAEKIHVDVPVWVSNEGVMAGNPSGRLFALTERRVRFKGSTQGASIYRKKDGNFQYLTSLKQGQDGSSVGLSDSATVTVIRNGQVI